jgi:hypothetical protein
MLTVQPSRDNEGLHMPTITVPEVRLPKVDLSQIELPKMDLPKVDLSQIELPKFDLGQIDLPREIEERMPGRRRTNPLPFVMIGLGILAFGAWLVAWSPIAPRIRAAVSDARARIGIDGASTGSPSADEVESLDEYDVDPLAFGEPEPVLASGTGPAFEPDRSAFDEPRSTTLGS